MRLWSLHPKYLDSKGLVALWQEALLAQEVLKNKTTGYKKHSQLIRFQKTRSPQAAIANYLWHVYKESERRNYKFDVSLIGKERASKKIAVTDKQLKYELRHLKKKLQLRNPAALKTLKDIKIVKPNSLFYIIRGPIEEWEKVKK
jgi:hypothetical protein